MRRNKDNKMHGFVQHFRPRSLTSPLKRYEVDTALIQKGFST